MNYQEGEGVIQLTGLTSPHFLPCPKPGPGFPTSNVVFFLCSMIWARDECSFCWYWRICWPSLFNYSFHEILTTSLLIIEGRGAQMFLCVLNTCTYTYYITTCNIIQCTFKRGCWNREVTWFFFFLYLSDKNISNLFSSSQR